MRYSSLYRTHGERFALLLSELYFVGWLPQTSVITLLSLLLQIAEKQEAIKMIVFVISQV